MIEGRGGWLSMVFRAHGSVVKVVWPRFTVATLWAVAYVLLLDYVPLFRQSLTITPFLVTALPLGIILGFRNSSSYDRFWEGRKLLGALTNSARSLVRQLDAYVRPAESDADAVVAFRKQAAYRVIAFAQALRLHLRGDRNLDTLAPLLGTQEVAALGDEASPPAAILHRLGADIAHAWERGWLNPQHVLLLEGSVVALTDVLGGCERIKNTPTPISYLIFIHRAVAVYCFLLPVGVHESVKVLTPLVVFFVSYAFFSLDAIGDELDDPFRVNANGLPLAAITRNIEIYVRRRLGERELPPPLQAVDGILN